jgi:para-nitrobenzyl esterase
MTIVDTSSGPVRGRPEGAFLGVPYASPPVGRLRFAEPRPHEPWSEVRDATTPGPTAPQPARSTFGPLDMSPFFGRSRPGDDYLTVDIHTPAVAGPPAPVLVFVHGGAFVAGTPDAPAYDGRAFVRDGVVFVSVGYRLGLPGFLDLPGAPRNRGLLDVLAAVAWLRKNIARFGGDPDRITLCGQSAGAMIVGAALASAPGKRGAAGGDQRADGPFRRAIVQSGSGTCALTPEQAAIVTEAASRTLGVFPTVDAYASIPDAELVAALPHLSGLDLNTATATDPLGGLSTLGLVADRQPADEVAAGAGRDIDLLVGHNTEEFALYLAPAGLIASSTEEDALVAARRFSDDPNALLEAYRRKFPQATMGELRTAIMTDGVFGAGTRRLAEAHAAGGGRTHVYGFGWRSSLVGAGHAVELPFVFDRLDGPGLTGAGGILGDNPPQELATAMHGAWVRFVSDGDPGWPAHPDQKSYVGSGTSVRSTSAPSVVSDSTNPG